MSGDVSGLISNLRTANNAATELDLEAIKARAEAATEGPWQMFRYRTGGGRIYTEEPRQLIADMEGDEGQLATVYNEGDREFLLAARTDVPALIAEVERLRAIVEALA